MKPSKPGVRSNVKNKKLRSRRNCRADATYKRVQARKRKRSLSIQKTKKAKGNSAPAAAGDIGFSDLKKAAKATTPLESLNKLREQGGDDDDDIYI